MQRVSHRKGNGKCKGHPANAPVLRIQILQRRRHIVGCKTVVGLFDGKRWLATVVWQRIRYPANAMSHDMKLRVKTMHHYLLEESRDVMANVASSSALDNAEPPATCSSCTSASSSSSFGSSQSKTCCRVSAQCRNLTTNRISDLNFQR
jgi:hypothetical protein